MLYRLVRRRTSEGKFSMIFAAAAVVVVVVVVCFCGFKSYTKSRCLAGYKLTQIPIDDQLNVDN
jgi:hypothetical protein